MEIRKANLEDLKQILALNLALFKFERAFGTSYSLVWTYSEYGQSYFKRRLTQGNGIVFLVLEVKMAIGYICGYVDNFPYREPSRMGVIDNMFIKEDSRRQGVGSKLIEAFELEAKQKGATRIKVEAIFANNIARNFYRNSDFSPHLVVLEKELR